MAAIGTSQNGKSGVDMVVHVIGRLEYLFVEEKLPVRG